MNFLYHILVVQFIGVFGKEYYDLSYSLNNDTIFYPGQKVEFELRKDKQKFTDKGYWYATYSFCMAEHGGTHVDAPFHFWKEGWKLDEIPDVHMLDVPAAIVDLEQDVHQSKFPHNFTLQVQHLIAHEAVNGRIPIGGVVIMHTGWGKYWPDKEKFLGWINSTGEGELNFPACSEAAAKWLANERKIVGFGIDTPSVDLGNNKGDLPVHVTFGQHQIYNIENLANLHLVLRATRKSGRKCRLRLFVVPLKITGGTGGPTRVLAYCK